jgi:hypothetical protein
LQPITAKKEQNRPNWPKKLSREKKTVTRRAAFRNKFYTVKSGNSQSYRTSDDILRLLVIPKLLSV